MPSADPSATGPRLQLVLAVVVGVAVVGFFVGTSPSGPSQGPLDAKVATTPGTGDRPTAPSYLELRNAPWTDGAGWSADTTVLRGSGLEAPVDLGDGDVAAAVDDRAEHRAYDGAPPTIPHAVRQDSAAECLACHDEGLRLRGRIATPVSHDAYTSCTQCHVVEQGPMPGERLAPDAAFAVNLFEGLASPVQGERAWAVAPPVIPHRTLMRERCMSCHGPNGRDAMRSTHPSRQSCEQCHAGSAEMDMRGETAMATAPAGELP